MPERNGKEAFHESRSHPGIRIGEAAEQLPGLLCGRNKSASVRQLTGEGEVGPNKGWREGGKIREAHGETEAPEPNSPAVKHLSALTPTSAYIKLPGAQVNPGWQSL